MLLGAVPNLTLPIFWGEESGQATAKLAQQFQTSLYRWVATAVC
jgi:hypothetical protein